MAVDRVWSMATEETTFLVSSPDSLWESEESYLSEESPFLDFPSLRDLREDLAPSLSGEECLRKRFVFRPPLPLEEGAGTGGAASIRD